MPIVTIAAPRPTIIIPIAVMPAMPPSVMLAMIVVVPTISIRPRAVAAIVVVMNGMEQLKAAASTNAT
jgi:hypothetical protein